MDTVEQRKKKDRRKVYVMAKELIKDTPVEVEPISQKDIEALERTTKKVKEYLLSGRKAIFNIALQLAKIEKQKLYLAGGYKSVTEYAEEELELKRATVNNYIRVANRFLETNNNGTFSGVKLTDTAKEIDAKSEYPITTLTELLVLDDNKVKQITDDGEVDSSMNQKQVRKVVAMYKPKKDKEQKEAPESADDNIDETEDTDSEEFDSQLFNAFVTIDDKAKEYGDSELSSALTLIMNKLGYHF